MSGFRTVPNPDQPDRCPSIDPYDTLQCARRIHDDDRCAYGGIGWKKGTPRHVTAEEQVQELRDEVERLAAMLSRVEGRVRMLVDEVEDECVRDYGAGVCVTHECDLVPIKGRMACALIADLDSLISDFQALNGEFRTLAAEEVV